MKKLIFCFLVLPQLRRFNLYKYLKTSGYSWGLFTAELLGFRFFLTQLLWILRVSYAKFIFLNCKLQYETLSALAINDIVRVQKQTLARMLQYRRTIQLQLPVEDLVVQEWNLIIIPQSMWAGTTFIWLTLHTNGYLKEYSKDHMWFLLLIGPAWLPRLWSD